MNEKSQKLIYRTVKQNRFMIVDKAFLNDKNLSLDAKGLLCYLLSKPDNFQHNERDILNHCSNGRDSVRSAINCLIKHGYIRKLQSRLITGKFNTAVWMIYENPNLYHGNQTVDNDHNDEVFYSTPITEKPSTEKPATEKPQTEKPTHNNIDINNKDQDKKIQSIIKSQPQEIRRLYSHMSRFDLIDDLDFDLIDLIDLKAKLDYFDANLPSLKSPKMYFVKLIKSIVYLNNEQIALLQEKRKKDQLKIDTKAAIEAIEFDSADEMTNLMLRYSSKNISFKVFSEKPEFLPEMALYTLKRIKYCLAHGIDF